MIEDMFILIAAAALVVLIYLLHRDNVATAVDPYREALIDRDAQRVRADLLAGGDHLRSTQHHLGSFDVGDWEPRA